MRSLFAGPTDSDPPAAPASAAGGAKGWDRVSGTAKLAMAGGLAAAIVGFVVLPGLGKRTAAPQPHQAEQHPPAPIHDYDGPPPAEDVVSRLTSGTAAGTGSGSTAAPHRHRPVPTEMALYSPVNATSLASAGPAAAAAAAATARSAGEDGEPRAEPNDLAHGAGGATDPNDRLAASVGGATRLPTSHATLVRNADFVIRAGDVIPCLPVDAQNSGRPGFTTCKVPEWFRSSNQRRGLMPPGTRIFGQIRSGLAQGEMRLGVLYTLIQTPRFNMPVAAPGADAMGRAGLDGDVQTFFWGKAGAVGLYALMDVGVGAGQNLASSALSRAFNGGNGQTLNLGSQAQGLASQQFASTINQPPVLTRDQALPITVTVGQDLDFTEACKLAMQFDPIACPLL